VNEQERYEVACWCCEREIELPAGPADRREIRRCPRCGARPSVSSAPTLADIGITRDQSSRWQKLADIPQPEFERRAGCARAIARKGGKARSERGWWESMNNRRRRASNQQWQGCTTILGMEQNCSVCGVPARPLHVYQGRQLCGKHCPECGAEKSSSGGREPAKTATQFQPEEFK
jgi:hypothetical protein